MKLKKNITIVGVGLIGGSLAIQCRSKGIAGKIIGVDIEVNMFI